MNNLGFKFILTITRNILLEWDDDEHEMIEDDLWIIPISDVHEGKQKAKEWLRTESLKFPFVREDNISRIMHKFDDNGNHVWWRAVGSGSQVFEATLIPLPE